MESLRERIAIAIQQSAEMRDAHLSKTITDDQVLLESGLDSLGFAILVARLEEELGYDPFVLMNEPVYPKTFGEFVSIYERYRPAGV